MPDGNGDERRTGDESQQTNRHAIDRRRLLQLTGLSIVGSAAISSVAANGDGDAPHEIVFDGTSATGAADYEFGVSGAVEPHGDVGALEAEDTIDGTSVTGSVQGDRDAYRFGGHLTALDAAGTVDVAISYADTTATGAERLEILTPSDGSVQYAFTVDGGVEKVLDNGDNSAERANDTITDNGDGTYTVSGLTGNGYGDTFDISGEVTHFEPVTGQFTLLVDGTETTVSDLTGQTAPDDGSGDTGGETEPETHVIEIVAQDAVEYVFTTSGEIRKDLDAGRNAAEERNDDVEQTDATLWTASGTTGNGYGDTYVFEGEVRSFDIRSGDCTVTIDGEPVDPDELGTSDETQEDTAEDTLDRAVFRIGFPHDEWLEYRLHTDSEPTPLTGDEDEYFRASNYDVTELSDGTYLVEGRTGTADPDGPMYGDGYRWEPADGRGILGWDATVPDSEDYVLTLNEDPVDPSNLPDLDLPEAEQSDDGANGEGVVGGGEGYEAAVTRDQADAVVGTLDELADALSAAGSGDVVFVPGDRKIDFGSTTLSVPAGVTLASDRGVDGSDGALVHTDAEPTELFGLSRDARITGLRIRGPWPGDAGGGSSQARGVGVYGDDVEIDNNDVWGFSFAGVYFGGGDGHVHHNVLRECNMDGLGYGVVTYSGDPLIEYNYFNNNRHSVASDGSHYGYRLRFNHFGPVTVKHVIDVHSPGGVRTEIRNNVVEPVTRTYDGNCAEAVDLDGEPDEGVYVEGNWFFQTDCTFELSGVSNKSISGNHYGTDAGVSYEDVIPGYSGWRS